MDVVIGECFTCNNFTINPPEDQVYCGRCRDTVYPIKALKRHTFPSGCRIDPSGAIFAPDGSTLLRYPRPEKEGGEVAQLRTLLESLDRGQSTEGEVAAKMFRRHIQEMVTFLQAGETYDTISTWCGPEVPPTVTVRAEIEYDWVKITVRPL